MALAQGRRTETPVGERIYLVADAQRGEVEQADDRGDDALGAEGAAGEIVFQTRAEQRQRVAEGGAAVIFVGVLREAEIGVIAILLAPARVIARREAMAVRPRAEPAVLLRSAERRVGKE